MKVNLKTSGQYLIFQSVLQKALDLNFDLEYAEAGYNSASGYVYIWSEMESYQIGIADYAFHRGEEVECIITCPETGEEFFAETPKEAYKEYVEYCNEKEIEVELEIR